LKPPENGKVFRGKGTGVQALNKKGYHSRGERHIFTVAQKSTFESSIGQNEADKQKKKKRGSSTANVATTVAGLVLLRKPLAPSL